ncbi:MAG: sigma-54 interaction domain-containing protein [Anaerovoracaceae bacterium]
MKTVCVVYENFHQNYPAIEHNFETLKEIFGEYIQVKNYSIEEMQKENGALEGDAYLVSRETLLAPLRNFISDFKKIILMERSILKQGIPQIMDIPSGSDVLVVNDALASTLSTVYELYELGFNHLNLIPLDPDKEPTGVYRNIKYAVTPNELTFVPPYIKKIVNIQYRVISFSTLLKLMDLLQLDANQLHLRLIRHLNSIAQPNLGFHNNYTNNYLKSQMLDLVVADSESAILVVNYDYHLVYFNEQANLLFNVKKNSSGPLSDCISEDIFELLRNSDDSTLIELNGDPFLLQKTPLKLVDQLMGYCLTLQNENNLREIESKLTTQLRKKGLYAQHHFQDIIHQSPAMASCISMAKQASATDYTILIRGESGVGKELMAQSIHNFSSRKNAAFVAINCAALPESLLESQLFGYEEGAFTGAHKKGRAGLFEQAHLGTLFLDEIGDISPNLQSQLLRVLQEKQVMRIGSDQIIHVDVRIIAATNQDLEERVKQGLFREDLFYRLNVIPIEIVPLRQRREDILPLLERFLGKKYDELPEDRKQQLVAYNWPGNVRQLENAATYYKTMGMFPAYLSDASLAVSAPAEMQMQQKPEGNSPGNTLSSLSDQVLKLIADGSAPFHGVGRAVLLPQLRELGFPLSDGKLRQVLGELEAQHLITVGRGRIGCRITSAGQAALSHKSSHTGIS